jgi:hypothetical protein
MLNGIRAGAQLRYTGAHGPLVRADGKTKPIALDDIERLYGEFVLNEVMENPGRWVDVTAPDDAVLAATVNERVFTVHVVPADRVASDFTVDADAGTITLPVNASMFSLVQALHTAKQHEPSVVTTPAASTMPYRCWSRRGGEIVCLALPGIGKREIPMESAAAHPPLREIFNRVREAESKAWVDGPHATRPRVFVHLSDEEAESLLDRDPRLPQLRLISTRPVQLRYTDGGTNPAA